LVTDIVRQIFQVSKHLNSGKKNKPEFFHAIVTL